MYIQTGIYMHTFIYGRVYDYEMISMNSLISNYLVSFICFSTTIPSKEIWRRK